MPDQARQLAAIMFTDIVGYTSLMGEDEQKAFELLKKNRSVQRPLIEKFSGRWLKEIGDGVLASFPTATDAVYCAKKIQETCHLQSDLNLRIGIHLGEVVFEGNDVFGDGVNIASRLEPLAPVGGILVSESVHRNLGNKTNIVSTFLQEVQLKNVDEPIKVYQVQVVGVKPVFATESSTASEQAVTKSRNPRKMAFAIAGALLILLLSYFLYSKFTPTKQQSADAPPEVVDKSIAVLPFANDSPDPDNEYFCNGMFDEILTHLQKIGELKVKSRTSVEQYRNPDRDIREIAEELEAAFLVEGSVRKAGDDLRITVQLIDAKTGDHLWAETYDGKYTDKIFDFQSKIAKQVAASLNAVITLDKERIESVPTSDLTAYDFYLRGLDYKGRGFEEDNLRLAIQMFERAVEIDSNFTLAWVGLAAASRFIYWFHYDGSEEQLAQTEQYLAKATSLDPDLWEVQNETARYYFQCRLNYSKALQILEKSIFNYPNIAALHSTIGYVYRNMGEFEMSVEHHVQAISLNSSTWFYWWAAGNTLIMLGRYTEAEGYLKTVNDLNPSDNSLARKHLITGEVDKARTLLENTENWSMRSNIELIDRNYQEAIQILESSPDEERSFNMHYELKSLQLGLIYYVMSNKELANKHFHEARKVLEEKLSELPNDSRLYGYLGSSLGIVYAGLGMTEEAMAAGNKALTIMNMSVSAIGGFYRELDMARILLMTGEHDEAIEKLEFLIQRNGLLSVEILKRDPLWDPLREINAFKALIENPKYQINLEDE